MTALTERVYEKRDTNERYQFVEYSGPENKWPQHKVWKAVPMADDKGDPDTWELASDQDIHLWYRVVPPAK